MKIWEGGQQMDVPGLKLLDWASPTTLYVGEARPGGEVGASSWQIQRITFNGSGDPIEVKWANTGLHTAVWDDRASLEYK